MCIRDSAKGAQEAHEAIRPTSVLRTPDQVRPYLKRELFRPVSYTHLRAHETVLDLVCRLLLDKKKYTINTTNTESHNINNHIRLHLSSL